MNDRIIVKGARENNLKNIDVEIPKNKIDPKLASKIISSELPGIMNWVLQGRERLMKQNTFTESRVMANALDDYKSKYTKKETSRIKLLLPPYL